MKYTLQPAYTWPSVSYDMAQTRLTSIPDITVADLYCTWLSISLSLLYTIIRFNVSIIGMEYTSEVIVCCACYFFRLLFLSECFFCLSSLHYLKLRYLDPCIKIALVKENQTAVSFLYSQVSLNFQCVGIFMTKRI